MQKKTEQQLVIDTHVHFYDPRREDGLTWPRAGSGMMKSALPIDLLQAVAELELDGVIAIESSRRHVDDQWLLDLANREDLIKGVVLNLQPDLAGFDERFAIARQSSYFRGIRLRPLVDYDFNSDELLENITLLSKAGYSVEFGARTNADKLVFARMAQQFPASTWILDHCGHPDLDKNILDEDWLESMAGIAEQQNVLVKVTNPYGLARNASVETVEDSCSTLISTLDSLFGSDRLMFGSNWPVSELSADYDRFVRTLERCFVNDRNRARFFERNSRCTY